MVETILLPLYYSTTVKWGSSSTPTRHPRGFLAGVQETEQWTAANNPAEDSGISAALRHAGTLAPRHGCAPAPALRRGAGGAGVSVYVVLDSR